MAPFMNEERMWICNELYQELREYFNHRHIDLLFVDLSAGCNESNLKNGSVFEACRSEIIDCRPYFIGTLGHKVSFPTISLIIYCGMIYVESLPSMT
jgi:hypothetical protein